MCHKEMMAGSVHSDEREIKRGSGAKTKEEDKKIIIIIIIWFSSYLSC